ncbi:uncharacterized protein LOC107274396 [Cephus cinctus]|uniref:Uncharacterized protein LOC107274396 n=1 Tax=Cephus cinctus TaxID=211228 RepID=A0AAJ7W7H8_CEPCN|nr:uncharacterized protein LOC107274396 [Cephus cinctus]
MSEKMACTLDSNFENRNSGITPVERCSDSNKQNESKTYDLTNNQVPRKKWMPEIQKKVSKNVSAPVANNFAHGIQEIEIIDNPLQDDSEVTDNNTSPNFEKKVFMKNTISRIPVPNSARKNKSNNAKEEVSQPKKVARMEFSKRNSAFPRYSLKSKFKNGPNSKQSIVRIKSGNFGKFEGKGSTFKKVVEKIEVGTSSKGETDCKALRQISKSKLEKDLISEGEFTDEPEIDHGITSTDESPATVGNTGERSAMIVYQNYELKRPCRACSDQNFRTPTRKMRDPSSDSRSSQEITSYVSKVPKFSKNNGFVHSSTDDPEYLSDYSSDNISPVKLRNSKALPKNSLPKNIANPLPKTNNSRNPPKIKARPRNNFSFFDALFDIVFWPLFFFRSNR